MQPNFHLSIAVESVEDSTDFFVRVLKARLVPDAPTTPQGGASVDWFGHQITLKKCDQIGNEFCDFHFGVNLAIADFDEVVANVRKLGPTHLVQGPKTLDAGTPQERQKICLRCPTGYLIEVKGFA